MRNEKQTRKKRKLERSRSLSEKKEVKEVTEKEAK
jgi:hypothetical protein